MDGLKMDQTSHEVLPQLPHELIVEILLRLPVKSLLKFRFVSKSWLSLISSSQFIKTHLKTSSNNKDYVHHRLISHSAAPHYTLKHCSLHSLLQEPVTHADDVDCPVQNTPSTIFIVGSCNGLICIVLDGKEIHLWNPSMKKTKKLIDSGFIRKQHCYTIYGFGYNEANDDYNVVAIFRALNHVNIETKVYSLKADNWRKIEDFPSFFPFYGSGKYANGKLHWAGYSGKNDRGIVSLDSVEGKYGEVKLPINGEEGSYPILGVLGGCLSVTYEYHKASLDVWIMKEYGVKESWIKVLNIPSFGLCGPIPLCISGKVGILMQFGSEFRLYNLEDHDSLRNPKIKNMDKCNDANIYVESLVSPHC